MDLENKPVSEILKLVKEEFGDRLIMTTSFGYSGIVLMSFIKDIIPEIPIYFFDTGFHFKETLELADRIEKEWRLNIIHLCPDPNLKIDYRNSVECCSKRKTEPFLKVLKSDSIWISALRRDQSGTRQKIPVMGYDSRDTLKINPLYQWSNEECWNYIHENQLPYNTLIDKGYMSIGCEPCTSPLRKDEDERTGRWRGTSNQGGECGLHGAHKK